MKRDIEEGQTSKKDWEKRLVLAREKEKELERKAEKLKKIQAEREKRLQKFNLMAQGEGDDEDLCDDFCVCVLSIFLTLHSSALFPNCSCFGTQSFSLCLFFSQSLP